MPSFKTWQRIFSVIMLTSMIISLVVPAVAAMPAPPNNHSDFSLPATIDREASTSSFDSPTLPPQQEGEKEIKQEEKAAEAAECTLLDNPATRDLMSAMFERKLLVKCGRQAELGQVKSPALPPSIMRALGTDVLVNDPTGEQPRTDRFTQSETSLARNEDSSVICSAYNDSYDGLVTGQGFTGFSSSTDKGATWTDHGGIGSDSHGDPANVWSKRDNTFYHASLHSNGLGLWSFGTNCITSTFVSMIHTGTSDDKELMAVDNNPSSPYYGRLYVAWTDFSHGFEDITYSDNGGATWSTPIHISAGTGRQGAWPVVDPSNGDVYVAWLDRSSSTNHTVEIVRSTDGGATWSALTNPITNYVTPQDNAATANCGRQALNGDIRYLDSPQIAVDKNSNLHVVYSYDPDGNGTGDVSNVYYRRSTDQGATWEAEIQLNDDGTTTDQWFPALTVNDNGVVGTFWYDRRLDTANNYTYDYYKAVSLDNGQTFLPNERVSDVSSNVVLDPQLATCYHGDYDTSVADASRFYIQWASDLAAGPVPQQDPNVWSDTEMILTETGWLSGTVTDLVTANPIENALIRAQSISYTFVTTTNDAGHYATIVASDTYTITAAAYGYAARAITGVQIVSGATVTADFILTPLPQVVISGTVTDVNTGWPLYAQINVSAPGFAETLFSNPVTGYYSVTVAQGITHTFHVGSRIQGYQTATRNVMIPAGGGTENFALTVDSASCNAPGYIEHNIFYDGFESGSLGASWSITTTNDGRVRVDTSDPYEGQYSVLLDSAVNTSYSIAGVILTQDLSGESQVYLDFWWHEYNDENDPEDGVFISDDNGANWCQVLSFNNGPTDYRNDVIDLTAALPGCGMAFNASFQVKFQFYDNYSITTDGYTIDEVKLKTLCTPTPGGLVVGNVYDNNTNAALNGADVNNENGYAVSSAGTPTDPAVDDGFYALFSPAGSKTFTATLASYGADVQSVTVVQSDTIRQNFHLPAGQLSYAPAAFSATLELGDTEDQSLTLNNNGGSAANFELAELNKGSVAFGPLETPQFLVRPHKQNRSDTSGVILPAPPKAAPFAAGDVLQSWPTGTTAPWGIAFDGNNDSVWVGEGWGDDTIREFSPDGTATGRFYAYPWNPANGPADATYNHNTGMVWVMNVASPDDCIYEIDPTSGYTGNTICPSFGTSQRGLAYDPSTDTYFAGSWNDSSVHRFASDGTMLSSVNVGLAISGLAYNADTEHLFVMVNDSPNPIYVLDAANGYNLLGQFTPAGFGDYSGAGLEMGPDGNLWAVNQGDTSVYQIDSGETTSMFVTDVPWISENPITGTVASASSAPITITFDAGQVNQPGEYHAQLKIKEDTPYTPNNIPVTLTVTPPATWGKAQGTITDHCTGKPVEADIAINGGNPITQTASLTDGTYSVWLQQGSYPFEYSAPGYITKTHTLTLTAGMTTTQNVDFVPDKPCLAFTPKSYEVWLVTGTAIYTAPVGLELVNNGAQNLSFEITEQNEGYTSTLPTLMRRSDADFSQPALVGPLSVRSAKGQATPDSFAPNAPAAWAGATSLPAGDNVIRYAHAQCPDDFNSFYVISGVDESFNATANVWRYDADANTWNALAPIPTAQEGPAAVCYEGYIYVLGGGGTNQFYIYDIAGDSWTAGPALPRNVWGASIGAWDGSIYMIGGDDDFSFGGTSNAVDIYDITAGTWSSGAAMPSAAVTAGDVQAGEYVYVVGGWGDSSPTNNITATQRYDMASDAWETGPTFSSARSDFALAITKQNLYAIGGDANGGGAFDVSNLVETLDHTNWPGGSWTDISDPIGTALTALHGGFCTESVAGGEVWAVNGYDSAAVVSSNQYRVSEGCFTSGDDVPWFWENPVTGTVASNANTNVDITFTALHTDTTPMALGTYTATMLVKNNDSVAGTQKIPVVMHIVEAGHAYTLTVNVVGNGVTTPAVGAYSYPAGETVNLSATPAAGWRFNAWSGDVSSTTPTATITINGTSVVTATFTSHQIYLPIVLKQ